MLNKIEGSSLSKLAELSEIQKYLNQCWLFLPEEVSVLPKETIDNWAEQISCQINQLSHGHMFAYSVEQAQADLSQGMSMALTSPDQKQVLSYIKKVAWPNSHGTACWEVGSLFTDLLVQNHGVGKHMVKQFYEVGGLKTLPEPIIAVVTIDNLASLNVFRACQWTEIQPTPEASAGFSVFNINGANIFEDWGLPSSIFTLPKLSVKQLS